MCVSHRVQRDWSTACTTDSWSVLEAKGELDFDALGAFVAVLRQRGSYGRLLDSFPKSHTFEKLGLPRIVRVCDRRDGPFC